jgi:hypothetical protein
MRLAPEGEIERIAHDAYRKAFRTKTAVRAVNVEPALALAGPPPVFWAGREYPTRPVSVPEGIELHRVSFWLDSLRTSPPTSPEELDDFERRYWAMEALFWGFLDPKPAANPFRNLLPQEVGELHAFFTMFLTRPDGRSRLRKPAPARPTS